MARPRTSKTVTKTPTLTLEKLVEIARNPACKFEILDTAATRVNQARDVVNDLVKTYEALNADDPLRTTMAYGATTGFGEFKSIPVLPHDLFQLQTNIILSHAVGLGATHNPDDPANYYPPDVVRAALVIRINAFLQGHSGVRMELVKALEAMLHDGVIPLVPIRGSVGSSGDLCPLSHMALPLLGRGVWYCLGNSPVEDGLLPLMKKQGWPTQLSAAKDRSWESTRGRKATKFLRARETLKANATDLYKQTLKRIQKSPRWQGELDKSRTHGEDAQSSRNAEYVLCPKEGLALTNGANFSAAMLALSVHDADELARTADAGAALSLEAMCGRTRALHPTVQEARGMQGQMTSAAAMLAALQGSRLTDRTAEVQDVYSLRCAPQVHGASRDVLDYARAVALAEINAPTDNPLYLPEGEAFDAHGIEMNRSHEKRSVSAGNFHGQPVGMACDCLAIACAELANIAERRIQLLLDSHHNRNLPGNLIPKAGLNSGFMIAQYTAAGLVSENKGKCFPSTVDSIPTSANSEDHNAMATTAARKLREVIFNVQGVLAIELLCAAQAVEWRVGNPTCELSNQSHQRKITKRPADGDDGYKPHAFLHGHDITTDPNRKSTHDEDAEKMYRQARERAFLELATDDKVPRKLQPPQWLGVGTRRVYEAIRQYCKPMLNDHDRVLADDIAEAAGLVRRGTIARVMADVMSSGQ